MDKDRAPQNLLKNKQRWKKILLASTSTIYGGTYLSYLKEELKVFFAGVDEILFIPYARPSGISHDEYTQKAKDFFATIGKKVVGIHTFANPAEAVKQAKAIFTGGGNTLPLGYSVIWKWGNGAPTWSGQCRNPLYGS